MSDNLMLIGRGEMALPRDARRASRAISRHQAGAQVRTSQIDADVDVAMAKADAATAATGQGMAAVTKVAKLQEQLELMTPAASARLEFLATTHLYILSDCITDLARDLRRR